MRARRGRSDLVAENTALQAASADNKYRMDVSKHSTHSMILSRIGVGNIVLDVGCNTGYLGARADDSNTFYGIDCSKPAVEEAKSVYLDAICCDLNHELMLPWGIRFDLIVFADVMEHLLEPEATLREIVERYLAKDGRVIVSLPNVANWKVRLDLLLGRFDYADKGILDATHLHFYTLKTARCLVRASGLEIDEELFGASVLGPIISRFPLLASLLATNTVFILHRA